MKKNENYLPLLDLFYQLHEEGLSLGIDDYHLLVRAIKGGFGVQDYQSLYQLCCTIWVKSDDEKRIFDLHFERLVPKDLLSKTLTYPIVNTNKQNQYWNPAWFRQLPQYLRFLWVVIIIILLLVIILLLFSKQNESEPELSFEYNPIPKSSIELPPSQSDLILEKIKKMGEDSALTQARPSPSQPPRPPKKESKFPPPEQVKELGLTPEQVKKLGLTLKKLRKLSKYMKLINQLNLNEKQLEKYGFVQQQLVQIKINSEHFQLLGTTLEKVKKLGLTPKQVEKIRITPEQLKEIGVTSEKVKKLGLTPKQVEKIRITPEQSLKIGLTSKQVQKLDNALDKILRLGDDLEKIRQIGKTRSQGQKSGLTLKTLEQINLTPEQLKTLDQSSDLLRQLKTQNHSITIKIGTRSSPLTERTTLILLFVIPLTARLITARREVKSSSTSEPIKNQTIPTVLPEQPNLTPNIMDLKEDIPQTRYALMDKCVPISCREMQQGWRRLRQRIREGASVELDLETTIRNIERKGMLLKLAHVPCRINRAELLLLIDNSESMVPFNSSSYQLAETAIHGGCLGRVNVYYFCNLRNDNSELFSHSFPERRATFQDVLACFHLQRTSIMIFSDAGAARGHLNTNRISETKHFLDQLKQKVHNITWLNPVPCSRWNSTTAGKIAEFVPMFQFDYRGFQDAINVSQGKN